MTPRRSLAALGLLALGSACHAPALLAAWEERVGPAPNLSLPTLGGCQLWADVRWRDGWRVQRHVWTGHHRLLDPGNERRAWGTLARCEGELRARAAPEAAGTHLVVLLHGLGRTRRSLGGLERALEAAGWRVARLGYPSTRGSVQAHAADVAAVLAHLEGVERVSFVTHSLGGLVARAVLADPAAAWRAQRAPGVLVQLAPPNRGAELARRLGCAPLRWVGGPAFAALARGEVSAPAAPDGVPVTVITGSRGTPGGWNPWVRGDDDGMVSLEEARLDGCALWILPGALHPFVMDDPRATRAVLAALR